MKKRAVEVSTPSVSEANSSVAEGKPRVFITRRDIPQSALNKLKDFELEVWDGNEGVPREIFLQKVRDKEALFICSTDVIDKEIISSAPYLKVIATMSSGIDHIDVGEVKKRNIKLGCTKGVLDDAVAELAMGLLISGLRKFGEGQKHIESGTWPSMPSWDWMNGRMIKGSIVSIVGFGSVGSHIAGRLVSFKPAKILYFSRKPSKEANKLGAIHSTLQEICTKSDIIFVTLSLNRETEKIFDEEKFAMMKKNAFIVNISRGKIIDQNALIKAVSEGKIAGAALDVMVPEPLPLDHEMIYMKNITLTPHLGSAEITTRLHMAEVTAENIVAGLKKHKLPIEV